MTRSISTVIYVLVAVCAALVIMGSSMAACSQTNSLYPLAQVDDIALDDTSAQSWTLSYRPMLESAYSSPGVQIDVRSDRIDVGFIRCSMHATCTPSAPARRDEGGLLHVTLQATKLPVYLRDEQSSKLLRPAQP